MPKRMLNGERLWGSSKLGRLTDEQALAYAYLYPIALADGTFEADPEEIWATCFARRKSWSVEKVTELLEAFEKAGLLVRRKDVEGKVWGFWTGSENELPKRKELFHLKVGKKFLFETKELTVCDSPRLDSTPGDLNCIGLGWVGLGRVGLVPPDVGLQDEPSANTSKPQQTRTMKMPEIIWQDMAAMWQAAVPGGLCPKPVKGWWKGFEEALAEVGGDSDVLLRAFELYVKENADSRENNPMVEFIKLRKVLVNRVREKNTEKKPALTGKEPELQAAFKAQDKKYSEQFASRTPEQREADRKESERLKDVI